MGDAVLKSTIRQLREAIGDDAESPQLHSDRTSARAIGSSARSTKRAARPRADPTGSGGCATDSVSAGDVLGRQAELDKLRAWLDKALAGERQVVFVTGEAGIGKTTLVNALLEQAAAVQGIWMARGQCLEQYGEGEAYLPVLDGLSRLGRGPGGERIVALLRRYAPAWLLELPSLVSPEERKPAARRSGRRPERTDAP